MDSSKFLNDDSQLSIGWRPPYEDNFNTANNFSHRRSSSPYSSYPSLGFDTQSEYNVYRPHSTSHLHMNQTMQSSNFSVSPQNPNTYSYTSISTQGTSQIKQPDSYEYGFRTVMMTNENFNPVNDALNIYNTLMSNDIDKDIIINIICKRSLQQRIIIAQEYKKKYGDIIHDLKAKLNGEFRDLIVALMTPLNILDVQDLHKALQSYNFNIVPEIICPLSNEKLLNLKSMYLRIYGKTLESYIKKKASTGCRKLLLKICKCMRDETNELNAAQAEKDARILKSSFDEDESYFLHIFTKRSFQQIKLTCEVYEKLYNRSIEKKIKNIFTFFDQQGYLVISRYACNEPEYYAKRLRQSMKGLGTNNEQLIRIIVIRSDIDLKEIKEAFYKISNETLKKWIEDDTSGNFKYGLLALIGEC